MSLNQYMATALATSVGTTTEPRHLRKARKDAAAKV
jgi:hypothetical protein